MPAPVYDQVRAFGSGNPDAEHLRIRVYPLQRTAGALLLTVDFTPQDDAGAFGVDHFDIGNYPNIGDGVLRNVSLIDTEHLVRSGPLLHPGQNNTATYSSNIPSSYGQSKGVTYRIGGFFPDPGPSVNHLSVDLQLGGMVPDVPISADTRTAPGLVTGPGLRGPCASGWRHRQ